MIKLVFVCASMVAVALAALPLPLRQYPTKLPSLVPTSYPAQPGNVIKILRLESDSAPDGSSYQYAYDTENGISAQESGSLTGSGPEAALAATGGFQYTSPEGVPVQVSYVADVNGFQPSGNVLPTPPPTQEIPLAILRSLEYNAAHPEPQTVSAPVRRY